MGEVLFRRLYADSEGRVNKGSSVSGLYGGDEESRAVQQLNTLSTQQVKQPKGRHAGVIMALQDRADRSGMAQQVEDRWPYLRHVQACSIESVGIGSSETKNLLSREQDRSNNGGGWRLPLGRWGRWMICKALNTER